MFYFIIHNYIFSKNKNNDDNKYIKTLIFGSLLYIITHAFINDKENELHQYVNYIFSIVILDIVTFCIKEKFFDLKNFQISKSVKDLNSVKDLKTLKKQKSRLKTEETSNEFKLKTTNTEKLKKEELENKNIDEDMSDESVFIRQIDYNERKNDEIITDSFFQSENSVKKNNFLNSELIEYTEDSNDEDKETESIEMNLNNNIIST